ncbi:GEVED domain-containing protein [Crocinitomix algicola]|uniref:GEVED domain-containing protein n=1 Tax=Crocinitomix algicola TaxID=1740263 RepID=UPI0008722775|nr:GEVED domain-containing protein [Crocinitomix algicola]
MKKTLLTFLTLAFITPLSIAQQTNKNESFKFTSKCISMTVTPELRSLENTLAYRNEKKEPVVHNNFRRQKYTNSEAYPHGVDPLWQRKPGKLSGKSPLQNWEGNDHGAYPPDPSGAAGPDHYVQMINSEYIIYNKEGDILAGPNSLASIVGSDAGDPIVMYDRFADKWMLSAFGVGNQLAVAISQTPDPLGAYWLYTFDMASFPDYPKYGLWHDGYYVTANKSGSDCFVFERDKMIVGDPTAAMIAFDIPDLGTGAGTETGGFHSVLPAHADFEMPSEDKNLNLFYFQDDAWMGIPDDAIKIWEIETNWEAPETSNIELVQTLLTTPFDSQFDASWNDIEQPGTSAKLDGIPGAFMYRAQYTEWGSHNTIMLNHTVDVDMTNHAGIRWYELREIDGTWEIHQESTYAPDDQNRWLGSISMDNQGNIGLAYSKAGSEVYASLFYTGRYAGDPLGEMTIEEVEAVAGTSIQTGINRFGDYAHMAVDPTDDQTFWYTGEYLSSGRKTRIFSFKLASDYLHDVGITALLSPEDGTLTDSEEIEVNVTNFGLSDENDFAISYQINDGAIITETYESGPLIAGESTSFSFSTLADLSEEGTYDINIWTDLDTDEFNGNDTLKTTITHQFSNDLGVIAINSPTTGTGLMDETIQISIENFGAESQTGFTVGYILNEELPVEETVDASIAPGEIITYEFTTTGDFSMTGEHVIVSYTALAEDGDLLNDTTVTTIENLFCAPEAYCGYGDGFVEFQLGSIDNPSGCSEDGYGDYTHLMTDLSRGDDHELYIASDWETQYATIWIDFNDNFVFEEDEKVIEGETFDFGATLMLSIPEDAILGEHLLRAKASDNVSGVDDPCEDMTYGETEDYKVNIIPGGFEEGPDVDFSADILVAPPTTNIAFTDLSTNDPNEWNWTITPATGWVYADGTSNSSQNPVVSFNDIGTYTIQLYAANDIGDGLEIKNNYIAIKNFANIIKNIPFGIEQQVNNGNYFEYLVVGSDESITVNVHNAAGQLVHQEYLSPSENKTLITIDLKNVATGYYLLHVSDKNNSKIEKIWVK